MNTSASSALRMLQAVVVGLAFGAALPAEPCPPQFEPTETVSGVGEFTVWTSAVWDSDGPGPEQELLIVGGQFDVAGSIIANNIAAWNGRTRQWHALGNGVNHVARALAVYKGELVAGGYISQAGGQVVNGVARWNGKDWRPLLDGLNGAVYAMTIHNDELVVSGDFTNAGGVLVNHIARWNGNDWQGYGAGLDEFPLALATYAGELIAGDFRWDGSSWHQLGTGAGFSPRFLCVHNGELIAGGDFVKRWNGSTWSSMSNGIIARVGGLLVHEGVLYAATRTNLHPPQISRVFRWTGATWEQVGSDLEGSPIADVCTLIDYQDQITAVGHFTRASGVGASRIARWNGLAWEPLTNGLNDAVRSWAIHKDTLVAGGRFVTSSGIRRIAAYNDGAWKPLGQGVEGLNAIVNAVASTGDELVVGGEFFTQVGGVAANCLAKWDGANWTSLGAGLAGTNFGPSVQALLALNGELIVGGRFTTAGDQPANRIARWDGANWHSLGSGVTGTTSLSTVYAISVLAEDIIAAGDFTTAGEQPAAAIARWDGTKWHAMGAGLPGGAGSGGVRTLTVYNGRVIAGGHFSGSGGVTLNHIASWNGSSWQPVGSGFNDSVYALAVYHGDLYAAGDFNAAGAVACNHIARWDGSTWNALNAGLNERTSALIVHNNDLIIGGGFTVADGQVSAYWVRWFSPWPADITCDGHINIDDLVAVITSWGGCQAPCPPNCEADVDQNCAVDLDDLASVIVNWSH